MVMEETRLIHLELVVAFAHFGKSNTQNCLSLSLQLPQCRNLWEKEEEDAHFAGRETEARRI